MPLAEDVVLPLGPGLTVLTGETGAGKSLVAGALSVLGGAKVGRELIECKTGYGWLNNPTVQAKPWFPWAVARLEKQRYKCLLTASRCGFVYKWYMQNSGAASYLAARWKGVPPVLHKP